jgi:lipopolysaccharide export system permease protein
MTIFDRYILFMFLKIFAVCFLSFTGLFVVIHLFSNLDELAALTKHTGGWIQLIMAFYTPRVVELFDKLAPILILISAIFTINMMQKRSELTAMEAAGITKLRAIRPILLASLVLIGVTVANRELVVPTLKDRLVRTPQNWLDQGTVEMAVQHDVETGVKIRGNDLVVAEKRINEADVQLPLDWNPGNSRIHAQWANLVPANRHRPAGLMLHQVTKPKNLSDMNSIDHNGETIVYFPKDKPGIGPNQCFVKTDLTIQQMAYGNQLAQYRTTPELMEAVRQPRSWFGDDQRVGLHSRIFQPLLDLTLLLLGLPIVMSNSERNIFASAGLSFLVIGAISLVTIACRTMGTYNLIEPASLAAALPLIIFVPLAALAMRHLR